MLLLQHALTALCLNSMPVDTAATTFPTWNVTVNDTNPLWFYCKQHSPDGSSHCGAGMVFAVNPTAEKSIDAFIAAAKATAGENAGNATAGASSAAGSAAGGAASAAAGGAGSGAAAGSATVPPTATAAGAAGAASASAAASSSSAQAVGAAAAEVGQGNGAGQVLARAASPLLAVSLLAGLML